MKRLGLVLAFLAWSGFAYGQVSTFPSAPPIATPVTPANGGSGVANTGNLTWNAAQTLSMTSGQTMTLPAASTTLAGLGTTQTFSGTNTFSALIGATLGVNNGSTAPVQWNSDTTICRSAAGVVEINNGSACGQTATLVVNTYKVGTLLENNSAQLMVSGTAASINSGCGSTPSISSVDAEAAAVTIGTSPGTTCLLTLPTAAHGWACTGSDTTTPAELTRQTATSTTGATMTFYNASGTATAPTASDVVTIHCMPY